MEGQVGGPGHLVAGQAFGSLSASSLSTGEVGSSLLLVPLWGTFVPLPFLSPQNFPGLPVRLPKTIAIRDFLGLLHPLPD